MIVYDTTLKFVNSDKSIEIRSIDFNTMTIECCDSPGVRLPAQAFEDGERMLKRLYHANKPGVRCGQCSGLGSKWIEEGDRPVQDACYHCSNTGWIPWETWQQDRLKQAASVIAGDMMDKDERIANSNPDGEGFAFHAAENGMHTSEYRQSLYFSNEDRAIKAFGVLWDECRSVAEVLIERLSPAPKPKFVGETRVSWTSLEGWLRNAKGELQATRNGLAIRFDEPTDSYLVETEEGEFVWLSQNRLRLTPEIVKFSDRPDKETLSKESPF